MSRTSRALRAATAAAIGAGLLITTACSGATTDSSDASDVDTVGMGIQPWLGYGPWYIAQENGYFDDEGIDVELTSFMNDADFTAAFASGRIQVANAASHSALQFVEQGLDVTIIMLLDTSLAADAILTDGSITDVADLAGQSIAFEEGSVSNLLLGYALQEAGLSLDDITPVPMDPSEAATALIGGRVPAAVTYEPYISEAQAGNEGFDAIFTAAEKAGLISDVLVVDNDFLAENPEAVQKIVNAWGPAIDFYNSDTDAARAIIAENVGSDVEALTTAFEGVQYFSLAENKDIFAGEYLESVLPAVQDVASQIGILDGGADLQALVDPTFVEAAP